MNTTTAPRRIVTPRIRRHPEAPFAEGSDFKSKQILRSAQDDVKVKRMLTAIILFLILVAGAALRVYRLDRSSFWNDELLHVSAAQSLIEEGKPALPSGRIYKRALPFTAVVAGSFAIGGVNETTARIPAVLFGLSAVLLMFFVGSRWFNAPTGIIASALIALSPLCVRWSRECRMYTMFQLLYLALAWISFRALESRTFDRRAQIWTGAAVLTFALSLWVHDLTLFFIPTLGLYIAAMFFLAPRETTAKHFPSSRYSLLLIAGSLIVVLFLAAKPSSIIKAADIAAHFPAWAASDNHPFFYKWNIEDTFPLFYAAYPLALVFLCLKNFRKGFYVFLLFTVPFLLHSFIFQWKDERYLLYGFQFFLLAIAYFLAEISKAAWSRIRETRFEWKALGLSAILFALIPFTHPWLGRTMDLVNKNTTPPWREAYYEYEDRIKPEDLVMASEGAPLTFYGMKNLRYKINNFDENLEGQKGKDETVKDDYAGIPILTNLSDVEAAVKTGFKNTVWFFISDNVFFNDKAMPQDIKEFLLENGDWYTGGGREVSLAHYAVPKNSILVCRISGEKL